MNSKLYVGNISFQADDQSLEELFAAHGSVVSAKIITDRETGRSRGFGFVEMSSEEEAQNAIEGLDGKEAFGRTLRVNIAQDRKNNNRGGGRNHQNKRW